MLQIKGIHFKRFENGKLMKVLKDFIDSEKINEETGLYLLDV